MLAETLGTFATALFAPSGLLLLGLVNIWRRRVTLSRSWLILWAGAALWLFVLHALGPGSRDVTMILPLLSGFAAAALLNVGKKALVVGSSLALSTLLVAGAADLALARLTWQAFDAPTNLSKLWRPLYETVDARSTMEWSLSPAVLPESELHLSFEARLRSGYPGWNWHRSTPGFWLEVVTSEGEPYTHVQVPLGSDPYLMRTYTTPGPVGGKRFRATVTLGAEYPLPARGNRGIWLQTSGKDTLHLEILPVTLKTHWQTFMLEWTPPSNVKSSAIHLVLNDFDGTSFDIRDASLEIFRRGIWETLDPPSPTGVGVTLEERAADTVSSIRFIPTSTWQAYSVKVERGSLAPAQAAATLALEPGLKIDIRGTTLETSDTGVHLQPHPKGFRSPLWFGHPNFAGHTAVTIGLVFLTFARSGWSALGGLFVTALCVWVTGSRAAWLAALLGLPWLLWLACRPRDRARVFGLLFAASAVLLSSLGPSSLGRLQLVGVNELVSRPEIWRTAWEAFLANPITGVGTNGFASYWQESRSETLLVTHAHNLWLQFAAAYGLPGLVAILWLTGGFLYLAWKWGRWRGLALVVPIFIMNIFDYTFFYSGVLFPLILGMNALQQHGSPARAEP